MVTSVAIREFLYSIIDTTPNNSVKRFTVPAGEVWEVLSVNVRFTSSATAGNRQVVCIVRPPTGFEIARGSAGATQAANQLRTYTFGMGVNDQSAFIATYMTVAMPRIVLAENWQLEALDVTGVDPTGDDMEIRIAYLKRFVGQEVL